MDIERASPEDYPGILQLQAANYIGRLSAHERGHGFLSAEFTAQQIADMAEQQAIVVAREGKRVLGFVCASGPDFNQQPPAVARMIQEFDHVDYQGRRLSSYGWFLYGPVCIDRSQRGQGVLRKLYQALIEEVSGQYEVGVALVDEENAHSLEAHVDGLGMLQVGGFEHGGHRYHILAFSVAPEDVR